MKSFTDKYIHNLVIPQRLIGMIRQIGEYKGKEDLYKKQSPEILENLREVAIIQSTESSSRLEQVITGEKRFIDIMKKKTTPKNRNEEEIAGYRDVLDTIHSSANDIPFKVGVVKQFHHELMKYTPSGGGKWKIAQNKIIEKNSHGKEKIRFIPVEPLEVDDYMSRLHERFRQELYKGEIDPLILIPMYVLDFLCIHPFQDGNGRIARLIMLLLLYQNGYEAGRYISIEALIEKTKDSYYETLEMSSLGWYEEKHNVIPWINYFFSTMLAAYRDFEKRVGIIVSGRGSKERMIINAVDNMLGEFSIKEIEKICPTISRDHIRHVLNKMREANKIINISKGRNAKWQKI